MTTLIDILLIAIILVSAWTGYKKGMIMAIGSILTIIISLFGAHLLSTTYSYEIIPAVRPFADGYIEKKINADVKKAMGWEDSAYSIEDLLAENPDTTHEFAAETFKSLGIHSKTANTLADDVIEYVDQYNSDVVTAIVEIMCTRLTYALGFLLAFIMIVIILTAIGNITNLSFRLPVLHKFNEYGGLALGAVTGIMFCLIITWALKFSGLFLGKMVVEKASFANLLMKSDLLSRFIGI